MECCKLLILNITHLEGWLAGMVYILENLVQILPYLAFVCCEFQGVTSRGFHPPPQKNVDQSSHLDLFLWFSALNPSQGGHLFTHM